MIRKKKGENKTRFPMFSYIFLIIKKKIRHFHSGIPECRPKGILPDGKEENSKENGRYSMNRTATTFPKMRTMRVSPSPPISIGA